MSKYLKRKIQEKSKEQQVNSGLSNTKLYHLNEKPTKGNPTISELLKERKVSINKGP